MTSTEPNPIINARLRLGLSIEELALLLGVAVSTAYRWEKLGYDLSRIDPLQRRLLIAIESESLDRSDMEMANLGRRIKDGMNEGTLHGLFVLLQHLSVATSRSS